MSFLAPRALWWLLVVPLLALGYVALVRRRDARRQDLGTMGAALTRNGKPLGWRRHLPPVVFLVGVVVLLVGLARPQATLDLPHRQGTVVLAFDVSDSMRAKDLAPSRIAAAKKAARTFVASQPSSIRIGVVAFSDTAFVVQPPTRSKSEVIDAVDRLTVRGGTSIARGILTSLDAVYGKPLPLDRTALQNGRRQPHVPFIGSAAVVLLSDGDNTASLDPRTVAPIAAQAGVRIFPVGIGSPDGAVVDIGGFQIATTLDAATLKGIAARSGGRYFAARDAASLDQVYRDIDLRLTVSGRTTEVTALAAAAGLLLFLIGAGLSFRWYGRVV